MIIKKKKKSLIRKIFSFSSFFVAGILVVAVIGPGLWNEFYRGYQIEKEIKSLKKEIGSLEANNYKLSQFIEYYQTDEFKETEARKRLNLKKDGESVVIIKPSYESVIKEQAKEAEEKIIETPNYIKWWNYFFASKRMN